MIIPRDTGSDNELKSQGVNIVIGPIDNDFDEVKTQWYLFIKKKKKSRTVILIPKNNYTNLIENKIKKLQLKGFRTFKYSPDPKVLTGEIEILTNYSARKKLEMRKKTIFRQR